MSLLEHVYSVLVVSASKNFNNNLKNLLSEVVYTPIYYVYSINEAQREIAERFYDIIIINTPLPDDLGAKFAIDVSGEKQSVVLLFVKNDNYADVYEKVSSFGVFTVPKPLSQQGFLQSMDFAKAARERLRRMEKKTISIEEKMKEIKLVNRAKWILINTLNLSEDVAHHYIEKQAMDRCVSKRQIAEEIIRNYDR